jgi:hypothetical protein
MNDLRELFLGLFVQVRHGNTTRSAKNTANSTEQQGWHNPDVWWSCKRQSRQQDYRVQQSLHPVLLEIIR